MQWQIQRMKKNTMNRVSKRQAVDFVVSAVRNGALREVERIGSGMILVTLRKSTQSNWVQVVVSFHRSIVTRRWAISIRTMYGVRGSCHRPSERSGMWNARYALANL